MLLVVFCMQGARHSPYTHACRAIWTSFDSSHKTNGHGRYARYCVNDEKSHIYFSEHEISI